MVLEKLVIVNPNNKEVVHVSCRAGAVGIEDGVGFSRSDGEDMMVVSLLDLKSVIETCEKLRKP